MSNEIEHLRQKASKLDAENSRLTEALHQSEELAGRIFHASSNMMAIHTIKEGRFVDLNEAAASLGGFRREELIGHTMAERGLAEDPNFESQVGRKLKEEGSAHNIETKLRTRNGEWHTILASVDPITVNNEPCMLAVSIDITEREERADALRRSEEKYRTLVENSLQGLAIIQNSRFIFCNSTFAAILGYSTKELMSLSPNAIEALIHPDDRTVLLKLYGDQLAGKSIVSHSEYRVFNKDGREIWLESHTSVIDYGTMPAIQSVCMDITERKQAETALRDSEEQYHTLFDSAGDAIFIHDMQGCLQAVNSLACERLGYTQQELMSMNLLQLDAPEEVLKMPVRLSQLEKRGQLSFETVHLHKDGSRIPTEVNAKRILWRGQPAVMTIGRDFTERKRAEEQLQQVHNRYQELVEHAREGIFILDTDGCFQLVNAEICNMLGYAREELIGMSILNTYPLDIREDGRQRLARLQSGYAVQFERPTIRKDGSVITIEASAWKAKDGRVQAIVRDITKRKQVQEEKATLEAQLRQAQRMESVGRLAGGVAHDFNNMLGVILGHADLALNELDPSHSLYDDLTEIRKAAERSANLTRQLLTFARKQTAAPRVLDLNLIITNMLNMLQKLIGEDINLNWHPDESLWSVKIDPAQVDQIMTNLCVNARDAIPGVGKITIRTENRTLNENFCAANKEAVPGKYVRLTVSDDGCGMDKETLANIFEPFFTTKDIGKGTGLGLATIYGIVKQNNGFINVYSEPGHGSTFNIYLPRYADKTEQATGTEGVMQRAKRGHETILLVEDELSLMKSIKTMLEQQGYTVLAASTPGEAIRLTNEHGSEIHLLMTDVVMPGMNGRDLAENLLLLCPNLKLLFSSGYTADIITQQGVLGEGVHFIQKPFTSQSLAAKIRETLDQA